LETTKQVGEMENHQLIKSKEVEILYDQSRVSFLAAQSAALLYIYFMWGQASTSILLPWIIVFSLLNMVRYGFVYAYFKAEDRSKNYKAWLYRFLAGTTLSGTMWGGLALLILPAQDPNYTAVTILVISGLVGGTLGTYGINRPAYICYSSASLLPLSCVLLMQDETTLKLSGLIVVVYYIFMAVSMFRLNIMMKEALNLQFDNIDLLHQLEHEKEMIAAMNQELELDIEKRKDTEKELLHAKNKAEGLADALSMLSVKDALTDITNRRGFDEHLANAWNRAIRNRSSISLIMCDVDFFKNYNDHYGHPRGDEVLKMIATTIDNRVRRGSDLVARYGGEEFAIILPDAKIDQAYSIAEQIRIAVKDLAIAHEKSSIDEHMTMSLGVASVIPNMDVHSPYLIEQADQALYSAKAAGRNQVFPEISQDKVSTLDASN
jgi:diguanylate cyclase (GGDEF)-like protein